MHQHPRRATCRRHQQPSGWGRNIHTPPAPHPRSAAPDYTAQSVHGDCMAPESQWLFRCARVHPRGAMHPLPRVLRRNDGDIPRQQSSRCYPGSRIPPSGLVLLARDRGVPRGPRVPSTESTHSRSGLNTLRHGGSDALSGSNAMRAGSNTLRSPHRGHAAHAKCCFHLNIFSK